MVEATTTAARTSNSRQLAAFLVLLAVLALPLGLQADEGKVEGTFTANGEAVSLPHVYVYPLEEGFYDESDPAWQIIFAAEPIAERDLDDFFHDFPYVKLKITKTSEFSDGAEAKLEVYGQDVQLSQNGSNISGGTYPELELESEGPDRFAGRVFMAEAHEFFDDSWQYDFTFSAEVSDPNAPIGEALPADGGEPGKAYVKWVEAIQSGDVKKIKKLVPKEYQSELDSPDFKEQLEFLQAMTPTKVTILGGSSDGETAILKVRATVMDEESEGEVTLIKDSGFWRATESSF